MTTDSTSLDSTNTDSTNTATNTELTEPVTGLHTTAGLPHGKTSITPHIVVTPAAAALEFYRDVLGARIIDITRFPGGSDLIAHAELDFGSGGITMSDALESYGLVAPEPGGAVTYSLAVYVSNVDDVARAAAAAGATVREQPMTFVSGDRFASVVDPFGVRWSVMTRVEDLSEAESSARVAAWAAQQHAE
ncbi:putative glyoxalase superfamily protein PhnB [Microterricola gilva]|uniref:Putative glyoxalase superfamily protein PhnB n=1 Tax=Microterricola gilva TaxID=393267 RepID=A0A4Q8ARK9_9MICO|nr:VOC family protein [Microterricola gilva]RZU66871.1 putative glyoxalase superfamily protein PhnB [Microterricola gilva]